MAPPRPIQGSIGSRIKVILGDTGNSWLLLLDNDDGNRKWQSKNWKGIPEGLAKQINNCTSKGREIKYVDFGPTDSWFVHGEKADGSGAHSWWGGLVQGQSDTLKEEATSSSSIKGQYYIRDSLGSEWLLDNNPHFEEYLGKNNKVEDMSMAGDKEWIIIHQDNCLASEGVDSDLTNEIRTFFRVQKHRRQNRQREIREYHDRERAERVAREAAERERQEAAERERREAAERAAREEEERRAEEERIRLEEEERARKAAEESRATTLEVKLVEKLTQEKESIDKLETKLEVMQGHLGVMQDHFSTMQDDLYSRKRSLRESIVALPPAQRPRWNLEDDKPIKRQEKPLCVICHDKAPVRAVVPCGHLCLCDDCAPSILQGPSYDRLCPLCRGTASSTLRIYS